MPMTFLEAAEHVLGEAGEPLNTRVMAERALASGILETAGRTPWQTMEARIAVSIRQRGDASPFVRVAPRIFALRRWIAEGRIPAPPPPDESEDIRIPFFPEYDALRLLLPVLDGMERSAVTGLRAAIWEHRGTVEEQVDWTEPDRWIPERLTGDDRDAALKIWRETRQVVNPRHMAGHWLVASGYELLADGPGGRLVITTRGRDFIAHPEGGVVRELDEHEGLLKLLALVAEHGPATSGELLAPWMEYAVRVSRLRSETTGRSFVYVRLRNLAERGLVERSGTRYQVTAAGLAYLKGSEAAVAIAAAPKETQKLWELVNEQRAAVRDALRERLSDLDPYAFEHVVKRLLEEMGYTDVEVTARSGDKGVDVIGRIVVGITEVREVVQVKRQQGNIHRPVLDMLRGSLHRFGAVRGTIITLGGFAKGTKEAAFEPGAPPIQLIDGEKLLDLLIEEGIGVRTETLKVLELDPTAFEGEAE